MGAHTSVNMVFSLSIISCWSGIMYLIVVAADLCPIYTYISLMVILVDILAILVHRKSRDE